jgi:hypothetical protein
MPWRHGIMGWGVTAFEPDLACVGCFKTMWNLLNCERGDFACVNQNMVAPARILEAVFTVTAPPRPPVTDTAWRISHEKLMRTPEAWRIPASAACDETSEQEPMPETMQEGNRGEAIAGEIDAGG